MRKSRFDWCSTNRRFYSHLQKKWVSSCTVLKSLEEGDEVKIKCRDTYRDITQWKLVEIFCQHNYTLIYTHLRGMGVAEIGDFIRQHKAAWHITDQEEFNNLRKERRNMTRLNYKKEIRFKPKMTLSHYLEGFSR